jgi:hypothetical protein
MSTQDEEARRHATVYELFYESSNRDRWYLSQDPASGIGEVKHVGNASSGGHVSYLQIDSFLSSGTGPEHQALKRIIERPTATILIAYDIHPAEGAAYEALATAIQTLGVWWHHLEPVWIVQSARTPQELRDHLEEYIGAGDQLLILDVAGDKAAWSGFSDRGSEWLVEKINSLPDAISRA